MYSTWDLLSREVEYKLFIFHLKHKNKLVGIEDDGAEKETRKEPNLKL